MEDNYKDIITMISSVIIVAAVVAICSITASMFNYTNGKGTGFVKVSTENTVLTQKDVVQETVQAPVKSESLNNFETAVIIFAIIATLVVGALLAVKLNNKQKEIDLRYLEYTPKSDLAALEEKYSK